MKLRSSQNKEVFYFVDVYILNTKEVLKKVQLLGKRNKAVKPKQIPFYSNVKTIKLLSVVMLATNVWQADVRRALRSFLCLFTETVIKYTNFIYANRPAGRLLAVIACVPHTVFMDDC